MSAAFWRRRGAAGSTAPMLTDSTAVRPAFKGSSRITPALPNTKYMKSKLFTRECQWTRYYKFLSNAKINSA